MDDSNTTLLKQCQKADDPYQWTTCIYQYNNTQYNFCRKLYNLFAKTKIVLWKIIYPKKKCKRSMLVQILFVMSWTKKSYTIYSLILCIKYYATIYVFMCLLTLSCRWYSNTCAILVRLVHASFTIE